MPTLLLEEPITKAFTVAAKPRSNSSKVTLLDGKKRIQASLEGSGLSSQEIEKDDVLVCRAVLRQWQTVSGVKTEYSILEVLEHRKSLGSLL